MRFKFIICVALLLQTSGIAVAAENEIDLPALSVGAWFEYTQPVLRLSSTPTVVPVMTSTNTGGVTHRESRRALNNYRFNLPHSQIAGTSFGLWSLVWRLGGTVDDSMRKVAIDCCENEPKYQRRFGEVSYPGGFVRLYEDFYSGPTTASAFERTHNGDYDWFAQKMGDSFAIEKLTIKRTNIQSRHEIMGYEAPISGTTHIGMAGFYMGAGASQTYASTGSTYVPNDGFGDVSHLEGATELMMRTYSADLGIRIGAYDPRHNKLRRQVFHLDFGVHHKRCSVEFDNELSDGSESPEFNNWNCSTYFYDASFGMTYRLANVIWMEFGISSPILDLDQEASTPLASFEDEHRTMFGLQVVSKY
jgi:hypothetical protein